VIFPKVGGALLTNKKRVLGCPSTFDNNIMGIVPQRCEGEWLFYWFQTIDLGSLSNTQALPSIRQSVVASLELPLPPPDEQRQIAAVLRAQMAVVEAARAAAKARIEAALTLPSAFVRDALRAGTTKRHSLGACLIEIRNGVGTNWSKYPVLGATREGLAPAKEGVGKAPERYKLVDPVSVFYNPMRILLGSIAIVDEMNATGITSPDYVVVKGRPGVLDTRWFYYWFRSAHGEHLITSLSRGAVRERILFNRLAAGKIDLPDYETQLRTSEGMKQVNPLLDNIEKEAQTIDALPSAILRQVFLDGM
jgi:type I restriction enzyme S subunit